MAITRRPTGSPKPPEAPKREMDDAAFERVTRGAIDAGDEPAAGGGGRPGKGREKGKGYVMGNKRQITHMITSELLDRVDAEAERCGEARATVINRAIRQLLDRG